MYHFYANDTQRYYECSKIPLGTVALFIQSLCNSDKDDQDQTLLSP
jgi:hypothetical protein